MNQNSIAIIGIACRFPGAKDYNQFWENLAQEINSISEISSQRWEVEKYYSPNPQQANKSISKWGGLIKGIDQFDAQFFGISPREARKIDPQQRIMLELSWSCLEDGGYSASQLSGTKVGVFLGACSYDSILLMNHNEEKIEGHSGTGTWTCMIPNRISSFFNFHGPSIPIDTACSSSLVAIHYAVNSLKEKECEIALVGGLSVLFTPTTYIQMSQLGMLSPTGQCKTFDSEADGYVRGEGAGVILLKPLAKAIADHDQIYGVIKGSAINHGGKAQTLTSPNVYAQAQVLRAAYTKANVAPNTVSYIEAHGTGTPLGDPMEINALKRGFRQLHKDYNLTLSKKPYCGLGAVKTNIGHLEGAAGIAGVIKVLLAMKHKKLPGIINFKQLNPRIDFQNSPFYLITETQEWQNLQTETGELVPLRAGVSSFGIGGVNAHVVLEEAPKEGNREDYWEPSHHLLTLSAKTEKALADLVSSYHNYLERHPELAIADICHTANTGRTHFNHRLAIIASNQQELIAKLSHHQSGKEVTGVFSGKLPNSHKTPKVVFLFSGEDLQSAQLAQQLYETQPTFRQTIDKCDQILSPYLEKSLLEFISGQQATGNQEVASVCVLFTVQYAIAQLWQSWGIKPEQLLGHGVGEYVAACIAEIFSLEEGLKLIATRGKLMAKCPRDSDNVSEIVGEWETIVQGITYTQPRIPLVSQITGQEIGKEMTSAQYWVHQLQTPVSWAPSWEIIQEQDEQLFLEIGGSCLVSHSLKTIIEHQNLSAEAEEWSPSLHSSQAEWQKILETLGQLYVKGVTPPVSPQGGSVDWSKLAQDYAGCKIALPTYPFQRQRYWIETADKVQVTEDIVADSSPIFNLINQGDKAGLIKELKLGNELTGDEQKILTKLLESLINKQKEYRESAKQPLNILEQLKNSPERERLPLMLNYLKETVGKLLGLDKYHNPDIQLGFVDLGMNYSLMLELGKVLESSLGCSVSVTNFVEYFNIQKLAEYIIEQICSKSLEETKDLLHPTANNQKIKVESNIDLLGEEAIATAIEEDEIAIAIQAELNEITLLLNNEGD